MPSYKCPQLDNQHFGDKIALRETIIKAGNFKTLEVLDLFAGAGHIWTEMKKRFEVTSYLPVDTKPRLPGTLKLDVNATSVQAFRPDNFNVVDMDCYDSKAWEILPHFLKAKRSVAIFITYGSVDPHTLSRFLAHAVGMPANWRTEFYSAKLSFFCGEQFLKQQFNERFKMVRRMTYPNQYGGERVRYYGALLGPMK